MASQSLHRLKPLTCWHCQKPHSRSDPFCMNCNGWTMPTRIRDPHGVTMITIEWKKFVIAASDSEEARGNLMKEAIIAMEKNKYVAILGIQVTRDHLGQDAEKTTVFVHRAGGDKRLSVSETTDHASSRWWAKIYSDHDPVWAAFKQMVGKENRTYSLPTYFPEPDLL